MVMTIGGMANPIVQNYSYDPLYRLTEGQEMQGSAQNWIQQFQYDRFGNRTALNQTIQKTAGAVQTNTTPAIDPATNRFITTNQNFRYDKNGNLTTDSDNRTVVFDGENKQAEIKNASGQTIGQYFYDGEGKRVKKVTWNTQGVSETTIFVYSAGKLVAEYSNTQVPVTNPTTRYLTEDHLGTPRVVTDSQGTVISRRDFLPFGEQLDPDVGGRSSVAAYQPTNDNVKQKFTGYQKDEESGLDFAEARMYENRHGRFTTVDPLLASGKSANPQTFNRFVYVGNNPLARMDPNGLDWIWSVTESKKREEVIGPNGKTRIVETTTRTFTPYWVEPGAVDSSIERAPNIISITTGDFKGMFQALHPTKELASETFSTREEAQAVYDQWMKGTDENPQIFVVVFESTLFSGGDGATFDGVAGHVANGINDKTYSWDDTGYDFDKKTPFPEYLDRNFKYRTGTLFELDFGTAARNRAAAEEIRLGPRNPNTFTLFPSGYNIIRNNCGEAMCRVSERLNLPKNNGIAPFEHREYIETQLRDRIVNSQTFGPPRRVPDYTTCERGGSPICRQ